MRYNNSMAQNLTAKLCWCVAAFVVARCATPPAPTTTHLEKRNKILQQRVTEEKAENKRLRKFLVPDEEGLEPTAKDFARDESPRMGVTFLKPESVKPEPVEEDEDAGRKTIASSDFESMTWYQQGLEQLRLGRYDQAISAFTQFQKQNPEHVYSDRAQYWIAESYFKNREFGLAVVNFNLVASRYPHSVKVPESMYRAALCHLEMGQKRPAQGLLRDILRQYPADQVVTSASRKLAEISKPNRG